MCKLNSTSNKVVNKAVNPLTPNLNHNNQLTITIWVSLRARLVRGLNLRGQVVDPTPEAYKSMDALEVQLHWLGIQVLCERLNNNSRWLTSVLETIKIKCCHWRMVDPHKTSCHTYRKRLRNNLPTSTLPIMVALNSQHRWATWTWSRVTHKS